MKTFNQFLKENVFTPHNGVVLHRHLVRHLTGGKLRQVSAQLSRKEDVLIKASDMHNSLPKDLTIRLSPKKQSNEFQDQLSAEYGKTDDGHEIGINMHTSSFEPDRVKSILSSNNAKAIVAHEHEHYQHFKDRTKEAGLHSANRMMRTVGVATARPSANGLDSNYHNHHMELRAKQTDMAIAARDLTKQRPIKGSTNIKKALSSGEGGGRYKSYIDAVDPSKRKSLNRYINRLSSK
jgi:hypothetical protein